MLTSVISKSFADGEQNSPTVVIAGTHAGVTADSPNCYPGTAPVL